MYSNLKNIGQYEPRKATNYIIIILGCTQSVT